MSGSVGATLLRTVVSLGVVLALMWVAARVLGGRLTGGAAKGRANRNAGRGPGNRKGLKGQLLARKLGRSPGVQVVSRTVVDKGTSVVVVEALGRTMVLGVTGTGVSVLASDDAPLQLEAEADEESGMFETTADDSGTGRIAPWLASPAGSAPQTALAHSAGRTPASPGWKPVLDALRERTVRRP